MGKTLTSIIVIAAAIAVQAIPGVGQAIGAALGATLGASVVSAITLAGITAGFSLATSVIGGDGGGGDKPVTTETAIKTPRPPAVGAYGLSRLYGASALFDTAADGTAVDVFAIHKGRIAGVIAYYLGDEMVTVVGGAVQAGADGRYKDGAVHLYVTDGSAPGAGLPAITAIYPGWTASHRGDGVVLLGQTTKSVKSKVFQETYPQSSVPTPSIVAQWQLCPDPAAPDPLDESGWTWTENGVRHLLHYELVRAGPRVNLPIDDPDYATELAAARAAWWARKIAPTLDYWIEAAADCDDPTPLRDGGTEPRYRSCVAHKFTDQHKGPRAALLATFDGWMAPRADGAIVVYSGRYVEPDPADAIGPDEIVSYQWQGGPVDDDQAVNELLVSYISAAHDYNSVDGEAWRDEDDISRRGQVLSQSLDVASPSFPQNRRLAKRRMARVNAPNRGTVTTNIAGRKARGKRFIPLRIEEAGTVFFDGIAEITALSRNPFGGVTFQWVEADPNIDEWNPALEEGEPAATGARVPVAALDAPTITSAEVLADDTDSPVIEITGVGVERDDLTWYARWRVVGAAVWGPVEQHDDTDPGADVVLQTNPVPIGQTVEVEIAYSIGDGRFSPWSLPFEVEVAGEVVYDGGGPSD